MPTLKNKFRFPMKLQFFAEGDPPSDPPQDPPADPPQDPPQDPETFDKEYVEKLRKEAAKYRTKAKELETNSQTKQQEMMKKVFDMFGLEPDPNKEFEKQLSDAQTKAQEAEKKANERLIRAEVKSVATELGIVDADAALLLMGKENVKINDSGDVEGVKEALTTLVESKPYLKGQQGAGKGGNDFGGGTPPKDLDAQIKAAREKGDWREEMRLERQKAFSKN